MRKKTMDLKWPDCQEYVTAAVLTGKTEYLAFAPRFDWEPSRESLAEELSRTNGDWLAAIHLYWKEYLQSLDEYAFQQAREVAHE